MKTPSTDEAGSGSCLSMKLNMNEYELTLAARSGE